MLYQLIYPNLFHLRFIHSFIYLFYVHWGFVCKCVYTPCACLVPVEVRKGHQIDPLEMKLCKIKGHCMLLCRNKCF